MKAAYLVLALAACASGGGSGYSYKLEPAANANPTPKPANCDFIVSISGPQSGKFVTLGTLTPTDFAAPSLDDLKRSIQAQVCQLGGEYVIGTQSTTGTFTKALVLRAATPAPADATAPAPAPTPAPAGTP